MAGTLFDQREIDRLMKIAGHRVAAATGRLNAIIYMDGPDSAPPGFDNLDSPDKVRLFSGFISRQSKREQRGVVPGDLNQAIAAHPAVHQMASDAEAQQAPPQAVQ